MKRQEYLQRFETFSLQELKAIIDLKRTYIKKFSVYNELLDVTKYANTMTKIRNYDVERFKFDDLGYSILIYPDESFKELIKTLNDSMVDKIDVNNLRFLITVTEQFINQIDIAEGIHQFLRGTGFGYKLYKLVLEHIKYITSDNKVSNSANNIWYNLMVDKQLYCFTSNTKSGVILKSVSNTELTSFLDKVRPLKELIFDNELTQKIAELYGSMDIYTQSN